MVKIPDIIQLNDWEPKKFLRMILAIHLVMFGSIGLDLMGLTIPILRQVIGFVYLTFVPGIILLRILKLNKLGMAETLLISMGLSISFLMFSGFLLNSLFSFFNIGSPLSLWNVIIFIAALIAILSIQSYRKYDISHYEMPHIHISRQAAFLMLLPVLSILGTYMVNSHKNNIILLVLIVLIALIPVLVALKKIPAELYPLAIAAMSLSLLLHYSLISYYLTGHDIHAEYFFHKLVINNAFWNSQIDSNVNAMLSIVILPAVYSYFLNMDGAWVFKIVYPLIFSLIPLGLYCIYKNQLKSEKIAFFSAFFFISFFTFFTEMLSLARQQIAELFFVLLIFLLVQDTINENVRNILLLVFGASLVVSHYGISYIFIILILIIYLFSLGPIRTLVIKDLQLPEFNLKRLTLRHFVAFYIVFSILWYSNVSSSSVFKSVVEIGDHVYSSIFTEFFNPENRDVNLQIALGLADPVIPSLGREIHRDLQFLTQLFIVIGFFRMIFSRESSKLKAEYFYLIIASLFILMLSMLPYSAKSFNMTRIYHVSLFALSPLFILGGIFIIEKFMKIINAEDLKENSIAIILVILIPYFLFNTGFVYEMTNDIPTSVSLGMERMKHYNVTKVTFYGGYTPEQDVYGARWFSKNKEDNLKIFGDRDTKQHLLYSYGMTPQYKIYSPFKGDKLYEPDFTGNYYVFLNMLNVLENTFPDVNGRKFNTTDMSSLMNRSLRIYSNGYGDIYAKEI